MDLSESHHSPLYLRFYGASKGVKLDWFHQV